MSGEDLWEEGARIWGRVGFWCGHTEEEAEPWTTVENETKPEEIDISIRLEADPHSWVRCLWETTTTTTIITILYTHCVTENLREWSFIVAKIHETSPQFPKKKFSRAIIHNNNIIHERQKIYQYSFPTAFFFFTISCYSSNRRDGEFRWRQRLRFVSFQRNLEPRDQTPKFPCRGLTPCGCTLTLWESIQSSIYI